MAQEPRTAQERALELLRATLATSSWLPTTEAKRLVWAIRCAIVLGLLVLIASVVDKTLWDWLGLLIIPAVLAGGGLWFNRQQREREIEIADQRSQDEALQAYLDQMSQLLVDKDRPLRRTEGDDEVRALARARTLTVLGRVDGNRKSSVLQFLYESGLIAKERPVLDLRKSDLSGAELIMADLSGADLRRADLRRADLSGANLFAADLSGAFLSEADLSEANLGWAYLSKASFSRANLRDANLSGANLRGANLSGANLRDANLSGAGGWTEDQLSEALSLEGATMPNGKKYEDWRKSKGHGEDGEDGGPS